MAEIVDDTIGVMSNKNHLSMNAPSGARKRISKAHGYKQMGFGKYSNGYFFTNFPL